MPASQCLRHRTVWQRLQRFKEKKLALPYPCHTHKGLQTGAPFLQFGPKWAAPLPWHYCYRINESQGWWREGACPKKGSANDVCVTNCTMRSDSYAFWITQNDALQPCHLASYWCVCQKGKFQNFATLPLFYAPLDAPTVEHLLGDCTPGAKHCAPWNFNVQWW